MFELKPLKKPPVQNKPPAKVASAFKNAMNDNDDNKPTTAARPKISSFVTAIPQTNYQKILDETSKIVLEDPSIYSYDEHYDDIREKRKELEQVKKQNVGSRYIDNLKKASEKRKVEQSIVHEKIAEKELQREGGPGTGEKYVTASYKRMMEENRKFAEEDAAKEAYNKQHAASVEDNTSGMYKDLYKQDIFMGGYRPDIATMIKEPQKTAPQPQQEKKPEEVPQNKPQPQAEKRDIRPQEKPQEKPQERQPEQKEAKRERGDSRERSRSREKSPSKLQEIREEQKEQKEPEKELSKEEKLKLMKERYMQRKLNQSGAPAPANP